MKTVSLIAAGLLAFGFSAARADVGATSGAGTAQPAPANVPGSAETTPVDTATFPSGAEAKPPANVEINVSPPAGAPPVAAPIQQEVMPPARTIDANSAAIYGAVVEPATAVPPPAPSFYRSQETYPVDHTWVSRLGAGLLVGGGFEDFTSDNLRGMTGGGGTWNARLIAGTRQFVGLEAAYVGAARGVDALGVGSSAVLMSNGVEGAVRVNVPVVMRRAQLLEPFGFVGLGWSHYQVTNTNTNTSDLASDDDIMSVPVGGGLAYAIGRFMADARFTYRSTYYNDLMRTGGKLNNWGVGTQIGFSF